MSIKTVDERRAFTYRGLRFRPGKHNWGLEVWDEDRGRWLQSTLVNDRKVLNYYLYAKEGKWGTSWEVTVWDIKTKKYLGHIKFKN